MSDLEFIEEKLTLQVAAAESGISTDKLSYAIQEGVLETVTHTTRDGREITLVIRGDVYALVGQPGFGGGEPNTLIQRDVPRAPKDKPAVFRPSYNDALHDAVELVPVHASSDASLTEVECIGLASSDTYVDAVQLGFTGSDQDWMSMVSSVIKGT